MCHHQLNHLCVAVKVFFDTFLYFTCQISRLFLVVIRIVELTVAFVDVPRVIHYCGSWALFCWFNYYIWTFSKFSEGSAFFLRKVIFYFAGFWRHDVVFDGVDVGVEGCVSSAWRSPRPLTSKTRNVTHTLLTLPFLSVWHFPLTKKWYNTVSVHVNSSFSAARVLIIVFVCNIDVSWFLITWQQLHFKLLQRYQAFVFL